MHLNLKWDSFILTRVLSAVSIYLKTFLVKLKSQVLMRSQKLLAILLTSGLTKTKVPSSVHVDYKPDQLATKRL